MQQIQVLLCETFWNFFKKYFDLSLVGSMDVELADWRAGCMYIYDIYIYHIT